MKENVNLRLANLSKIELAKKQLNKIRGGGCCICGCPGPSSTMANASANNEGDLFYYGGGYGNGDFG